MRKWWILAIGMMVLIGYNSTSQNVAVTDDDGYTADPSAMLDVKATDKGMLVPRLTTAQRTAIVSPATGLLLFDSDEAAFFFYTGAVWQKITSETEYQTLSISNDTIYLTNGGFVKLPAGSSSSSSSPTYTLNNDTIFPPRCVFEEDTNWVCPEGVTEIIVELWGASGGGGGGSRSTVSGNAAVGGDGGMGGHNSAKINVVPGQTYSIVIGLGGTGGSPGYNPNSGILICGTDGTDGGDSSFDGSIIAEGGKGGAKSCARFSPTLTQHGADGVNGSFLNYPVYPQPTTRSYIPFDFFHMSQTSGSNRAPGGAGGVSASATDPNMGIGGNGQPGLCIIYY